MNVKIAINSGAKGLTEVQGDRESLFRWIKIPSRLRIAETFEELLSEMAVGLADHVLYVTGAKSGGILGCRLAAAMGGNDPLVVTDSTMGSVEKVVAAAKGAGAGMVAGIGGGKVVDVCKYAAHVLKVPFYCIPTQVSHDGIGSPVAVLRIKGEDRHQSLGASMPEGIFVPLFTVVKAPVQAILSGIGDLISNLNAIEDWKLAQSVRKERNDDYAMMISRTAGRMMYFELLSLLPDGGLSEPSFLVNLTEGLVLSGIAMEIAESSRPCSGSEHMISHAMDELYGGIASHGMQVGFGTVVSFYLRNRVEESKKISRLYRAIGIPTRPSDLGLSFEQFFQVMVRAPHTRPNRYTILDQVSLDTDFTKRLYDFLESK